MRITVSKLALGTHKARGKAIYRVPASGDQPIDGQKPQPSAKLFKPAPPVGRNLPASRVHGNDRSRGTQACDFRW